MESVRKRGKQLADQNLYGSEGIRDIPIQEDHDYAHVEDLSDGHPLRHIVPEAILGYIWWSVFFSLAPTIWYFPLNLMEISGYEAFAILALSPIFTLIPFVDRLVSSSAGIITSQLFTVVGVLSYHAPTAFTRLLVVSIAAFFAMLWLAGAWWSKSKKYREYTFWGMTVGFFLKLVLRIIFTSLNPLWTSGMTNLGIFAIGILCTIDRANALKRFHREEENKKPSRSPAFLNWVIVAFGVGAWLFVAQWLFAEVSVISRYTGSDLPSSSVMPVPGGILVLLSLMVGIAVSPQRFVASSWWWIFGGLSALVFYQGSSLIAFCGGLGLAVYMMSLFPRMANQLSRCSKGKCLTLAITVCIIFLLASVWVVAYNFVPGGVYARERNDLILAVAVTLMGFAVAVDLDVDDHYENEELSSAEQPGVAFFSPECGKKKSVFKDGVLPVLCLLFIVGAICMGARCYQREERRKDAKLVVKDPKLFTTMVWTVHFGYDNKGWHSFQRSVQLMKDTEADVIGILESDCSRPFVGSTDLVSYIEENLGFYADYGPKTKDHTWGAAIISRYPIVKSKHFLLPSPEGELAPALLASVNISGQIVDFVVVHMGNDGDDLDRKLQAEELGKIMDASSNPIVFLGYVTSAPGSRDYLRLNEVDRMKDIDYEDSQRWCQYIFYRDLMRVGYARISRADLSDTEVQLAKFRIPKNVTDFHDHNAVTTTSSDVDENILFSDKFGDFHIGDFYGEGHHFHMSSPKYFVPAE